MVPTNATVAFNGVSLSNSLLILYYLHHNIPLPNERLGAVLRAAVLADIAGSIEDATTKTAVERESRRHFDSAFTKETIEQERAMQAS